MIYKTSAKFWTIDLQWRECAWLVFSVVSYILWGLSECEDVWRHLVAAHTLCCQCCWSRPASHFVFYVIKLLCQVLRLVTLEKTSSCWNLLQIKCCVSKEYIQEWCLKKGSAALTPLMDRRHPVVFYSLTQALVFLLTAAPLCFNARRVQIFMNHFYKAVVCSFNLFCLLFVIVFQLIYGRCIPSHTRPWICPPSTTPVCMFLFFVSTFHLDIEHMDQRHWGWWSRRGEIEWKVVRDKIIRGE